MRLLITHVIFLLAAVSSIITAGDHFVEGSRLRQLQRSRRRARKEIDHDNIDEALYGWEPQFAPGCPTEQYACRDKSFCFPRARMCDNNVNCDDQSDEVNAICGYTTTPTVATSTESGITSQNNQSDHHSGEATLGGFDGTLKIAFITIGVAAVALGLVAAIYCLKHKLSGVRADPNQVTPEPRAQNEEKELEAA